MPNFLSDSCTSACEVLLRGIIGSPLLLSAVFHPTEAASQDNVVNEAVQAQLRQAATSLDGHDNGFVTVYKTEVETGHLIVYYHASRGVNPAQALEKMRAVDWSKGLCANPESAELLKTNAASFTIRFQTDQADSEPIQNITGASCHADMIGQAPRIINGSPLYPKPARDVALATILSHLRQQLLDFDSAKIECGDVSEAMWLKPVFGKRIYGYYIYCQINAKNAFGGYTGYQGRWYRFNGDKFEEFDQIYNKTGLVDP